MWINGHHNFMMKQTSKSFIKFSDCLPNINSSEIVFLCKSPTHCICRKAILIIKQENFFAIWIQCMPLIKHARFITSNRTISTVVFISIKAITLVWGPRWISDNDVVWGRWNLNRLIRSLSHEIRNLRQM